MAKGNNRKGNKEIKKPKQEKLKPASSTEVKSSSTPVMVGGKKAR